MEHATVFIAIDLIEDADVEHPVMDNEEEDRPFDERPIESLDTFLDKGGLVGEILLRKEIARRHEKQGHVELKDKPAEPSRSLGVGNDHQYDGNAFSNGYGRIPLHFSLLTFHFLQPWL